MTVSLFSVGGLAMWMGVARSNRVRRTSPRTGPFLSTSGVYSSAIETVPRTPLSHRGDSEDPRLPQLPQTPTFAEAGIPEVDDNFWIGLFVPARTPRSIIDRWRDATVSSVQSSAVMEKLEKLGAQTMTATPEQFDALVKQQISDNAVIIKEAGISQD
jgi:tripartite-type tricarboxylate transporter receptor subunit TctC